LTRANEGVSAAGHSNPSWNGEQILQLDSRIRRVVVVGKMGEVQSVANRGLAPVFATSDELERDDVGVGIRLALGASKKAARYFGDSLYVIHSFREYKILFVEAPESERIIAVVLPRSANSEPVYQKVAGFLKARPPGKAR